MVGQGSVANFHGSPQFMIQRANDLQSQVTLLCSPDFPATLWRFGARPAGRPGTLLHLLQQLQCLRPVLSTGADGSCVAMDIGLQASVVVGVKEGNCGKMLIQHQIGIPMDTLFSGNSNMLERASKTFSSDLKCPQLKERTESCLPNVCNVDILVQSLWFWGIPAYPKLIIPNINPLPKSKTPVSITANSCSASCHWSPLAHALMTALQAMTLGSNCSRCRRPRSRNDWCH